MGFQGPPLLRKNKCSKTLSISPLSAPSLSQAHQIRRHILVMIERLGHCISQIIFYQKAWKDGLESRQICREPMGICECCSEAMQELTVKRSYSIRKTRRDVRNTIEFASKILLAPYAAITSTSLSALLPLEDLPHRSIRDAPSESSSVLWRVSVRTVTLVKLVK